MKKKMSHSMWFTFGFLLGFALIVRAVRLNVAVIGAGSAGLATLKNIVDEKHKVDVFEQGESIGGIWWYTDKTGNDKYGNPIHSPMYQGLRSNGPYHIMEFPNYHYPDTTPSFPSHTNILDYMKSYVKKFDLEQYIKFHHKVEKVTPINNKWEVTVKNLANRNKTVTGIYDAIFVCSGAFSSPRKLNIKGKFNGEIFHSHDYRNAAKYKNKAVLVIGTGFSGKDIVQQLTNHGIQVTLSQHKRPNENAEERKKRQELYGKNVLIKDDVDELVPSGVIYKDGTQQNFDVIIYAIGYNFAYPFFTQEVGIQYDGNHVRPLYKQILNINHPTMALIGVPYVAAINHMYDLQARFALKFISGKKKMPSKMEMLKNLGAETKALHDNNVPVERTHLLGKLKHKAYYKELADTAEIPNVDDVYADILTDALNLIEEDPIHFRDYQYTYSPNNKSFKRTKPKKTK